MKKLVIDLGIALGIVLTSILYATIWTIIFYHNFNYRVLATSEDDVYYCIIMFICFYHLGVYISAATFGGFFKRERAIASPALSSLVYCSIVLVSSLLIIVVSSLFFIFSIGSYIFYIYLAIILILQIGVVHLVYNNFENTKSLKHIFKKTAPVLLISLILLIVVCINDFPGVNAPIAVRQEWAYKKFPGYSIIVDSIERTNEITDKVGQIKFVAPTKGRNLLLRVGAGHMPLSNLTLEVVGEKGTGIAYICTLGGQGIWGISFEYQGKKTKLWGSESCG
jgi:hypothetical protein